MTDPVNAFLELAGGLDYPLFIVTAAEGAEREGCVIGFATQSSFEPPRFLACLSRANRTFRLARDTDALAVHLVPAEREDLAELFGGETGDEVDKFARCEWEPGADGAPVLTRLDHWFAGRILERVDVGDHVAFLLEPIEGEAHGGQSAFTFHRAKRIEPGHEP